MAGRAALIHDRPLVNAQKAYIKEVKDKHQNFEEIKFNPAQYIPEIERLNQSLQAHKKSARDACYNLLVSEGNQLLLPPFVLTQRNLSSFRGSLIKKLINVEAANSARTKGYPMSKLTKSMEDDANQTKCYAIQLTITRSGRNEELIAPVSFEALSDTMLFESGVSTPVGRIVDLIKQGEVSQAMLNEPNTDKMSQVKLGVNTLDQFYQKILEAVGSRSGRTPQSLSSQFPDTPLTKTEAVKHKIDNVDIEWSFSKGTDCIPEDKMYYNPNVLNKVNMDLEQTKEYVSHFKLAVVARVDRNEENNIEFMWRIYPYRPKALCVSYMACKAENYGLIDVPNEFRIVDAENEVLDKRKFFMDPKFVHKSNEMMLWRIHSELGSKHLIKAKPTEEHDTDLSTGIHYANEVGYVFMSNFTTVLASCIKGEREYRTFYTIFQWTNELLPARHDPSPHYADNQLQMMAMSNNINMLNNTVHEIDNTVQAMGQKEHSEWSIAVPIFDDLNYTFKALVFSDISSLMMRQIKTSIYRKERDMLLIHFTRHPEYFDVKNLYKDKETGQKPRLYKCLVGKLEELDTESKNGDSSQYYLWPGVFMKFLQRVIEKHETDSTSDGEAAKSQKSGKGHDKRQNEDGGSEDGSHGEDIDDEKSTQKSVGSQEEHESRRDNDSYSDGPIGNGTDESDGNGPGLNASDDWTNFWKNFKEIVEKNEHGTVEVLDFDDERVLSAREHSSFWDDHQKLRVFALKELRERYMYETTLAMARSQQQEESFPPLTGQPAPARQKHRGAQARDSVWDVGVRHDPELQRRAQQANPVPNGPVFSRQAYRRQQQHIQQGGQGAGFKGEGIKLYTIGRGSHEHITYISKKQVRGVDTPVDIAQFKDTRVQNVTFVHGREDKINKAWYKTSQKGEMFYNAQNKFTTFNRPYQEKK